MTGVRDATFGPSAAKGTTKVMDLRLGAWECLDVRKNAVAAALSMNIALPIFVNTIVLIQIFI